MGEKHFHSHVTTVTEKRAATDDSIRILNEMQSKTVDNILATVEINDNIISATGVAISHEYIMDQVTLYIKMSINGENFSLKKVVRKSEVTPRNAYGRQEVMLQMRQLIFEQYHTVLFEFVQREFDKNLESIFVDMLKIG